MNDPVLELDALDIYAPGQPERRQLVFGSTSDGGPRRVRRHSSASPARARR